MLSRGVIMAAQHRAIALGLGHSPGFVALAVLGLQLFQPCDVFDKLIIRHAALLGDIGLELIQAGELPLTWRVIHQADDAHAVLWPELRHFLQQRLRADLGPQMQEMADLEVPRSAHLQQLIRQYAGVWNIAPLAAMNRADPHRVEHCRDPDRGKLGIMRKQGRGMGPIHRRARLNMPFQIVGVQLHQPRHHIIASAIHGASWHVAPLSDLGDDAIGHGDAPRDHLIRQHDLRIGQLHVVHLIGCC